MGSLLRAFAGLSKLWQVVSGAMGDPSSLLVGVPLSAGTDRAQTFPGAALFIVATAEIAAAWFIATARCTRGLVIGAALLAVFVVTMGLWPIPPAVSCGCIGGGTDLPGSPVSRIALLGGMHAFALAALHPRDGGA